MHGMAAIPWVVLIVGTAVRFVEPELEEAALLDCSAWRVLRHVTLRRRVLPAIGVASVWIAVSVATEMTVTDIFQTPGVGLADLRRRNLYRLCTRHRTGAAARPRQSASR